MKFTTVAAVCGLFLGTNAIPTTLQDAPKPGYDVFIPSWEVELRPGGPKVIVNGTVEEVRHEMIKRNPDFEKHYPIRDIDLTKRTNFAGSKYTCNYPHALATTARIKEGVAYLYGLNGRPRNGAGPRACGRVSCSWKSAIWWCNDDTQPKTLEAWGSIADGANFLVFQCAADAVLPQVSGQVDHYTKWSVQVGQAPC